MVRLMEKQLGFVLYLRSNFTSSTFPENISNLFCQSLKKITILNKQFSHLLIKAMDLQIFSKFV
jgi:hypothetical protein